MSETKYIKIGESEQEAKKLLSAANRLEKKYPELQQVNNGICAVRSRFEAVCKPVKPEELDRRGSLIGGMPFTSREFPEPAFTDSGSAGARQRIAGMVPLAQLDLDQISACVNEDVGSGLLQVWMYPGLWTDEPILGDLEIRQVPRPTVDRTAVLLESSVEEDVEWLEKSAAELEVLGIIDPKRAEQNIEVYQEHYWSGLDGLDWTLSVFSQIDNWSSVGRFGAPQQITGWAPAGYTIPPSAFDPSIWDLPDDFHDRFPKLNRDSDYKVVCEILSGIRQHPNCALFDIYRDFHGPLYGNELYYGEDSAGWNWRPLFAFPGPLSDAVGDAHVIFYRKSADGFEYAGASRRWKY